MVHRAHTVIEVTARREAHREIARLSHHALHVLDLLGIEPSHIALEILERVRCTIVEVELVHVLHILHVHVWHAGNLPLHILHHLHVLEVDILLHALLKVLGRVGHAAHVLEVLHSLHLHVLQILQVLLHAVLHVKEILHLSIVWLLHLLPQVIWIAVLGILPGLDLLIVPGVRALRLEHSRHRSGLVACGGVGLLLSRRRYHLLRGGRVVALRHLTLLNCKSNEVHLDLSLTWLLGAISLLWQLALRLHSLELR